jgi:hypothetical protein
MTNQKGLAIIAIPLTIAILGLLSTGAWATFDHEKNLVKQRDAQRLTDMILVQEKLTNYFLVNQQYPLQKDEASNGWEILESYLGDLPDDPLTNKGWSYVYWSDSKSYTLRFMLEVSLEEQVIFSN